MGIRLMDQVRRAKIGSPTDKSLLMCLANRASEDGNGIWISIATMSGETEFARTTVIDALGRLEKADCIYRSGKSHRGTIIYNIRPETLRALQKSTPKSGKHLLGKKVGNRTEVEVREPDMEETNGVREPDYERSGSRTQTIKKPLNINTIVENSVSERNSADTALALESKRAIEIYNEFAKQHGWTPYWSRQNNELALLLQECVRQAGGIEGWKAEMQKAGESDYLCGRIEKTPFQNNLTYILKNFDKLLNRGFNNQATRALSKPLSSQQRNAVTMGKILQDIAQEFRVEDWKLKSKSYAPQFVEAVYKAVKLMQKQGIPKVEINLFMSLEDAA